MERLLKRLPLNRLMDLKVDFAFKQLFGHDKNKHITIIFLNAILKREGDDRINNITFVNTEFSGEHENDKQSRLDILATTNKDERVIFIGTQLPLGVATVN
ncbi:Rpn family recombination-promoting nuclease/putative transposase [Gracilibacillus oryzae]|uniref:Rpn family recombination-promoting nuclease/putative transposase n=1 Tax=Gracilibacillus oryzae TaxID=1672701 RepID=A0A7C8GQN9_9BACI|nr:Rpn family recombination-promoting nuclease/putative transposase [Gracilibacillus oryzae]